jgi:hypothetical protein
MNLDKFLSILFLIVTGLYLFRGLLNWVLLNQVNETNHPRIFNAKPVDLILTLGHLTISFLKVWWNGEEFRTFKRISNIVSGLLYLSILTLVLSFIIGYKL